MDESADLDDLYNLLERIAVAIERLVDLVEEARPESYDLDDASNDED